MSEMDARVTVTLPASLVRDIDRLDADRSKFLEDAARAEVERRRRDLLRQSLSRPHRETGELADAGLDEWANGLPKDHAGELVDLQSGTSVRWTPGEGWTED